MFFFFFFFFFFLNFSFFSFYVIFVLFFFKLEVEEGANTNPKLVSSLGEVTTSPNLKLVWGLGGRRGLTTLPTPKLV